MCLLSSHVRVAVHHTGRVQCRKGSAPQVAAALRARLLCCADEAWPRCSGHDHGIRGQSSPAAERLGRGCHRSGRCEQPGPLQHTRRTVQNGREGRGAGDGRPQGHAGLAPQDSAVRVPVSPWRTDEPHRTSSVRSRTPLRQTPTATGPRTRASKILHSPPLAPT